MTFRLMDLFSRLLKRQRVIRRRSQSTATSMVQLLESPQRLSAPRCRYSVPASPEALEFRVMLSGAPAEFVNPNPVQGDGFGSNVTVLTNGNVVILAPDGGDGAVYLFNGQTGALISTLTGTGPGDMGLTKVTALTNGNFVVDAVSTDGPMGTVTWGNGTTGVSGTISASNSLILPSYSSDSGVTALSNGNYVVDSPTWNNGLGAVTFGNGVAGVVGAISASNSLVGTNTNDDVGIGGVTALNNGNYVVDSPNWNGTFGAVTFGNGGSGVTGAVSANNSLVGSEAADYVGYGSYRSSGYGGDGGVTPLTNGNYVVDSPYWNGDLGAVTLGNGVTGLTGTISANNSLVGSTGGDYGDMVGYGGVTALGNGNYVVDSFGWKGSEYGAWGAVTFGNGVTGVTGTISASNSLVGSEESDDVGGSGVTALSNGNYVVDSDLWNNDLGSVFYAQACAVTFGNGVTGVSGTINASNSLIGGNSGDLVGLQDAVASGNLFSGGVTVLSNGNYVVESSHWNGGLGAATLGNGNTGVTGVVSASNSLVGSNVGDYVSSGGVAALSNGNYVVESPDWNGGLGAVTLEGGVTGVSGVVSATNSLVGSDAGDDVSSGGVTPLSGGNYVVDSPNWANLLGAVTFGNGVTGVTGAVSEGNSLAGGWGADITPLSAGSYVVNSPNWNGNSGAVTFAGSNGVVGVPTAANSELLGGDSSYVVPDNAHGKFYAAIPDDGTGHVYIGSATTGFSYSPPALPGGATVATSDVTNNGLVVDVSTGGALYYLNGSDTTWTQIAGNTSSVEVGANGTAYALLPYGGLYGWTLSGGWSFVAGNVSSYQPGPNGSVYVLQPGGKLGISQNGSLTPLKTNVSSFQVAPNGTVYAQLPYGALESWPGSGSTWTVVASNVSSYQVAANGTVYILQPGGNLSTWQNGSLSTLQTKVSSFQLAPNGTVYAQLPYGALESWAPGGSWTSVAGNVSSFQVGPNGTIYLLQPGGNLQVLQNGSLSSFQTNVSSFQLAPNGTVYVMQPYGVLESSTGPGGSWTQLEGNVSSFQVAPNGMLYALQPGGNLELWEYGSWALTAAKTSSFQFGSDGTLYDMLPYGGLYTWTGFGGTWSAVAGNVSSYQIASNGTLYVQQGSNLDLWENGSLTLLAANTSSFQVGPNGTVYLVLPGNALYSWTGFGGTWTSVWSNITSYQISANGTLFALQSGNLDLWENGSWSLLAANTTSFQLGPDGTVYLVLPGSSLYEWTGFGGSWTSLKSNITSFQVAPNGTLFSLQSSNLAVWENGAWSTVTGNASSFQIGPDGTVYVLLPGKALYSWTGFGGSWAPVSGNVTSYQVLPNGNIVINGQLFS